MKFLRHSLYAVATVFVRCLSYVVGTRVFAVLLVAIVVVDGAILNAYQRFIADPLQIRGFSLELQVRSWCFLVAAGLIVTPPHSWFDLLPAVMWLYQAILLPYPHLEPPSSDDAVVPNIARFIWPLAGVRVGMFFLSVISGLVYRWWPVAMVMSIIASCCDPKPRRPRRIKLLVPSTEGA